jgi:hypothetical protein
VAGEAWLAFVPFSAARCARSLLIERLAVFQAALEELGPFRDLGDRICLVRQEAPKRRMVPAQLMESCPGAAECRAGAF